MQMGGGGVCVTFLGKKRYEGVRFNVISITRVWVGVKIPGKKRYVPLEWPLIQKLYKLWRCDRIMIMTDQLSQIKLVVLFEVLKL